MPKVSEGGNMNNETAIEGKEKNAKQRKIDDMDMTALPFLQFDIILEILSWLPVLSFLRFKSVCKQWYALAKDERFIYKHYQRSPVGAQRIPISLITFRNPTLNEKFQTMKICYGLLLEKVFFSHKYRIRNPAIRQVLGLPDPQKGSVGMCIALNLFNGNHKLVSVYANEKGSQKNEGYEILSLVSDNLEWKPLEIPDLHEHGNIRRTTHTIMSTGKLVYFVRTVKGASELGAEIISLDFERESFVSSILLPRGLFEAVGFKRFVPFLWNDHLACVDIVKEELHVLLLGNQQGEIKVYPLTFLKESPDMKKNLLPLYVEHSEVWFYSDRKLMFSYNIVSKKIKHVITLQEGGIPSCPIKPSMITFKGMQPQK